MAEGAPESRDDVVCRYFLSSFCRDGDNCLFSHDSTRNVPDNVCRYYLQGICSFGQNCRFDHVLVGKEVNYVKTTNPSSNGRTAGPSQSFASQGSTSNSTKPSYSRKCADPPRFNTLTPKICVNNQAASATTPKNWIDAPEFVPKTMRSYADTVRLNTVPSQDEMLQNTTLPLCQFAGEKCRFGDQCGYTHWDLCDVCNKACLHPFDEKQRKEHKEECEKEFEKDMEFSFAVQRSLEKTCGICFDIVLKKDLVSERRFGILEKCNHVYCLSCIRTWRKSKQYENDQHNISNALDPVVTRACPECRIPSDFVIPCMYFVETEEEKTKLISEYKIALSEKPCKYFKQGEGTCPFGGTCFYLHAKPDGTKVKLPNPARRRQNQNGDLDYMERIFLWDYIEFRDDAALHDLVGLMELLSSDSDEAVSEISYSSESF